MAFSESRGDNYVLYRVFNCEPEKNTAKFYVAKEQVTANDLGLVPVQYRVNGITLRTVRLKWLSI